MDQRTHRGHITVCVPACVPTSYLDGEVNVDPFALLDSIDIAVMSNLSLLDDFRVGYAFVTIQILVAPAG